MVSTDPHSVRSNCPHAGLARSLGKLDRPALETIASHPSDKSEQDTLVERLRLAHGADLNEAERTLSANFERRSVIVSKHLSIADVELVCAVLERLATSGRGGASEVAAEYGLARSVISDKIARVEKHFSRCFIAYGRGRTGRVTEDGRTFLTHGRELLAIYNRLRDKFEKNDLTTFRIVQEAPCD